MDLSLAAAVTTGLAAYTRFSELGLSPVMLDLGFLQIRWYSIAYLSGILIGYLWLLKLLKTPGAPMARRHADDMILYATIGIIAGGRLGYVFFYRPDLLSTPSEILKLWEGGMSLHGGALGTIIAIGLMCWKEKLKFLRVCDYVACCIPFGLFFGRLANFVNGELWGRQTDVSWAIIFDTTGGGPIPRHPSQLYEAGLEGLLMFAILTAFFFATRVRYRPGFLFGTAAIIYGISRFSLEFVRNPDQHLIEFAQRTGLTMGQWLTIPILIIGIGLIVNALMRRSVNEIAPSSDPELKSA